MAAFGICDADDLLQELLSNTTNSAITANSNTEKIC
jgi:hypothetical protein